MIAEDQKKKDKVKYSDKCVLISNCSMTNPSLKIMGGRIWIFWERLLSMLWMVGTSAAIKNYKWFNGVQGWNVPQHEKSQPTLYFHHQTLLCGLSWDLLFWKKTLINTFSFRWFIQNLFWLYQPSDSIISTRHFCEGWVEICCLEKRRWSILFHLDDSYKIFLSWL